MKTIFNKSTIKGVIILVFFSIITTDAIALNCGGLKTNDGITGEEMFMEIFFLKNYEKDSRLPSVILNDIKSIENLSEEENQGIQEKIDYVFNYVKSKSPEYFTELKNAVIGKNHYEIKESLIKGGKLVNDAVDSLTAISSKESGIVIYGPAFDYTLGVIICYILPMPVSYENSEFTLDYYVNFIISNY